MSLRSLPEFRSYISDTSGVGGKVTPNLTVNKKIKQEINKFFNDFWFCVPILSHKSFTMKNVLSEIFFLT